MTLLGVRLEALFDVPIDPQPKLLEPLAVANRRLQIDRFDLCFLLVCEAGQSEEEFIYRRLLVEQIHFMIDTRCDDEPIQISVHKRAEHRVQDLLLCATKLNLLAYAAQVLLCPL